MSTKKNFYIGTNPGSIPSKVQMTQIYATRGTNQSKKGVARE